MIFQEVYQFYSITKIFNDKRILSTIATIILYQQY